MNDFVIHVRYFLARALFLLAVDLTEISEKIWPYWCGLDTLLSYSPERRKYQRVGSNLDEEDQNAYSAYGQYGPD